MFRGKVQSVSLLLNLVLLGLIAFGLITRQHRSGATTPQKPDSSTAPEPISDLRGPSGIRKQSHAQPDPQGTLKWRDLESSDYRTYIANLRSVGCPEETICDIIGAELRKLYDSKKIAQYPGAAEEFKFWLTAERQRIPKVELDKWKTQAVELDKERELMMVEMLGHACDDSHLSTMSKERAEFESRVAFLPEAKRSALLGIVAKFPGLEEQVESIVNKGSSDDPTGERLKTLERYNQKRAELAQILTPEEYERFEQNDSWSARNVRKGLSGFNPTEDEFRGIFKIWHAQDEALVSIYANNQPDPGFGPVNAEIQKLLGDERYDQYRRTWANQEVHQLAELAQDFQLSDEIPLKMDGFKRDIIARQRQISSNVELTPQQQAGALRALRTEAIASIQQELGPASQQYLANQAAWFRSLGP